MQTQQLIPDELLQKADKVLFVGHFAIGDYTYLQNCFRAFAQRYPHIKIDLFVDELRRTRCFWRWKHLKKYALYDWLEACPFINKIYRTYSPSTFKDATAQVKAAQYSVVISLAVLRPYGYALMARRMCPQAFIVGLRHRSRFFNVWRQYGYHQFDDSLLLQKSQPGTHVSQHYAQWFKTLCGVDVEDRFPFVQIPNKWIVFAKLRFLKWRIDKKTKNFGSVVFINPFAKAEKRCWPLENVAALIRAIKTQDIWNDVSFIVNVPPEHYAKTKKFFDIHSLTNVFLCCADYNFFQLPAIMSLCDLIISVETSTMHLANALHVPVLALMRSKNPEWAPLDQENTVVVIANQRHDWVKDITVDEVLKALRTRQHAWQK